MSMSRKSNRHCEIATNSIDETLKSERPSRTNVIVIYSRDTSIVSRLIKPNNVRDHRAGTSDHPLQKHAQVRLRVHHIVIWRSSTMDGPCEVPHVYPSELVARDSTNSRELNSHREVLKHCIVVTFL